MRYVQVPHAAARVAAIASRTPRIVRPRPPPAPGLSRDRHGGRAAGRSALRRRRIGDHGDVGHQGADGWRGGESGHLGLEVPARLGGRLGAELSLLLGDRGHPPVERARHRRVAGGRRRHPFVDVLVGDRHRGLAGVREPAGEQLERDDPERVQVGARVRRLAQELLRRKVLHRPGHVAGLGDLRVRIRAREPEVRDLHDAVLREHEVLGLHVSVHDPLTVRVVERGERLQQDVGCLGRSEQALRVQHLADAPTRDVLHHHVVDAVDRAPVVDGHDIRMGQVRRRASLAAEPLDEAGVARQAPVQDLDRDPPIEDGVVRAEDLAHPSGGDTIGYVVAAVECREGEREIRADRPLRDRALRDGRLPLFHGRCGQPSCGPGRVRTNILRPAAA